MASRSPGSPRLSGYRVRPALSARMAASTMCGGVSKSGSPRIKDTIVRPSDCSARISVRRLLTAVGLRSTKKASLQHASRRRNDAHLSLFDSPPACVHHTDTCRGGKSFVGLRSGAASSARSMQMVLSLKDDSVRAAFAEAAKPATRSIVVGADTLAFRTPFPSPQDWRDGWSYFLMLDRFNRSDGKPPVSMPYDKPFGE